MIENTANSMADRATLAAFYLNALSGGPDHAIEDQEKRGQQQLLNSNQLPTDTRGTDADFEALGFTFGAPTPGDPLFRAATLPAGWSRQGSDHDMWSYLVDELGRRRVGVFYKAAFYDRRANMRLHGVRTYVADCRQDNQPIVTDDAWATREAVHAAVQALAREDEDELEVWAPDVETSEYAATRTAELTAELTALAALAKQFEDSAL